MNSVNGDGPRDNGDARYDACSARMWAWLDQMKPGRRLRARDGTPFIRTNRTCICFCNLRDGSLCSARDICRCNGGVALREMKKEEGMKDGQPK